MEQTGENGSSLPFKRHADSSAEGDGVRDKAARKDTGDVLNRLLASGLSHQELLAALTAKASQGKLKTSWITQAALMLSMAESAPPPKSNPLASLMNVIGGGSLSQPRPLK
jgi:hypothetical protein